MDPEQIEQAENRRRIKLDTIKRQLQGHWIHVGLDRDIEESIACPVCMALVPDVPTAKDIHSQWHVRNVQ